MNQRSHTKPAATTDRWLYQAAGQLPRKSNEMIWFFHILSMVAERWKRPSSIILFAYSLARKLVISVPSKPKQVRKSAAGYLASTKWSAFYTYCKSARAHQQAGDCHLNTLVVLLSCCWRWSGDLNEGQQSWGMGTFDILTRETVKKIKQRVLPLYY